jgi:hypothetical protein
MAKMQHAKSRNLGQTCLEPQFTCTITPAQKHFMSSVSKAICWTNICEICDMYHNNICISGPELHLKYGNIERETIRSALFWDITQRRVIILYRRDGTTNRFQLQGCRSPRIELSSWTSWPLKMGPIGCLETSVQNCHSTLRNIPEERRSHLHHGGSLKSRMKLLNIIQIFGAVLDEA